MSEGSHAGARFTRAGLLASLLLLAVIAVCVRLGFWQLDRREQRLAENRHVAARMQLAPLADPGALADTAQALYRSAALAGDFDDARSIVLPGRSFRGAPGVHLVTPLRLDPERAVLVNRGWVPAPDGATIETDGFPAGAGDVRGLVLPFPAGSRRAPVRDALADSGFRRVWFDPDAASLRAQFPYQLLPVLLQQLPEPGRTGYPRALDPPALDQGPHLSYAIQWFSFAIIGLAGWVALLLRARRPARHAPPTGPAVTTLLALFAAGALPAPAEAQLRPLDPFDWRILDPGADVSASLGAATFFHQPASLAGSEGRLLELGKYRILWRSGRLGLELSGTAFWRYAEQDTLEPPAEGIAPARGGIRQDAGPASAATFIRLSPARWSTAVVLRFGARIPTTSDESGLDRDETDFFALAGARWAAGALAVAGEAGVGIHGSVLPGYPQSDVLLYNLGVSHRGARIESSVHLVGRMDGHEWRVRGNEDQTELRLAVRAGRSRWLQVGYVRGLDRFAPDHGLQLGVGLVLGCSGDCLP